MSGEVTIAVIAAAAAIISAVVALLGAREARNANRVTELEKALRDANHETNGARADREAIWLYCRELIDHIYKGKPPPPPQPPPGVLD